MKKKSQGMSVNVIIMAIIALITLIAAITIFMKYYGAVGENVGSCESKGGLCADDIRVRVPDGCGGEYPIPLVVSDDCEGTTPRNNLCCLKAFN